ncbi:MAG: SWIM zinc finger family protein, partial [Pseudomonadota bacterium]
MALSEILTDSILRQMAGSGSYARGDGYFLEDRVVRLSELNERISATVAGTHDYRVRLWQEGDELGYSCDCPIGWRDDFCKHCVAVALEWLSQAPARGESDGHDHGEQKAASTGANTGDIRSYLMSQDKGVLAGMLLEAAAEDELLQNRLMLRAAAANGVNLAAYKKVINQAIGRGRFIDYREMPEYWRRIDAAIDGIEDILDQG